MAYLSTYVQMVKGTCGLGVFTFSSWIMLFTTSCVLVSFAGLLCPLKCTFQHRIITEPLWGQDQHLILVELLYPILVPEKALAS